LVINSSPFPQGDEKSIFIVIKLNKGEWEEKGGKRKKQTPLKSPINLM
jgi:hypothetical protein